MKLFRLLLLICFCFSLVFVGYAYAGLIPANWCVKIVVFIFLLLTVITYLGVRYKLTAHKTVRSKESEITKKNEALNKLSDEREWLLSEIQHRVKNNLQIVISLLNTQSDYIKDKVTLEAIQDTHNRIYSISMIYKNLYNVENVDTVAMHTYVPELVIYLQENFRNISVLFSLNINEIYLEPSQALPVGLILNESINNSLKFAFNGNEKGIVEINLTKKDDNKLELSILDNGRGLPADFDFKTSKSFGMSLIRGLSEDIDGELTIYKDKGTIIRIIFPAEGMAKLEHNENG